MRHGCVKLIRAGQIITEEGGGYEQKVKKQTEKPHNEANLQSKAGTKDK